MDLMRSRVALRERALLDVLDLAVRFCAAHARAYMKLSLVVLAPAFAVSCAVSWAAGWWLGWAATVAMTAFAGAPFVALASRLVFADDVSTAEAVRFALRAFPPLAAVRFLQALALAGSVLLFGVPWLWLGTTLLFAVEVLLLEQQEGVGAALGRARRIAAARFGASMVAMLLLAAAPIAAALVADVAGREVLAGVLEIKPPPPMFPGGGSWLALAGWWATVPLFSTARFFVYLDIRTRAEGWDIQTRFAAIAARANSEMRERAERTLRPPRAVLLILVLLAVPCDARAAVDPSHAQEDVDSAMAENAYRFCREPREPLTLRARSLCAHASKIPGCEGFGAACARAQRMSGERSSRTHRDHSAPRISGVSGIVGALARVAVWLLVAAVVAAVLVPIARAVARLGPRARAAGEDGAGAADEVSVVDVPITSGEDALLARADDLARRGDNAAALELYLAAALRALDKRGAVRIAKDRTNGEYVRSCAEASAKPVLQMIVHEVDRVKFGGQDASTDVVRSTALHATGIVRALPTALLALALACAFGCARGAGARAPLAGEDPAGDELWYEVLRRQGVQAERLDTALASLPLPATDVRAPAVVVNLDRTELDRETRDHLVQWVDAGGSLVLAGEPNAWPGEFGVVSSSSARLQEVTARRLLAHRVSEENWQKAMCTGVPLYAEKTEHAELVSGAALEFPGAAERVAWFDDGATYAAAWSFGRGLVLGIATDELMTNVGLARAGNAAAMVAILSNADRVELRVAQEDDGVSPPSTPLAALSRAGLGVGLVHALVASLALFLAVGARLAHPRPSPPPRRRAFAEHVEAVGALYARARAGPQALAAYARFAEGRLRANMPRGATDVASFLASRSHLPLEPCQRLWARAMAAKNGAAPLGDELAVLEELSAACGAAMAREA